MPNIAVHHQGSLNLDAKGAGQNSSGIEADLSLHGDRGRAFLPVVLTVTEAAELLRVNRNTVYELFQRGEIPGGRKVGKSIRFSREALLQWLRGNVLTSKKTR